MVIKAILFDMGGVVAREVCKLRYSKLSKLSRKKLNLGEVEKRIKPLEHKVDKGVISSDEFWRLIGKKLGIGSCEKIKKVYRRTIKKSLPNKKILNLVKRFKRRGYQIGILSNTFKADASIRKRRGDYDLFSPVVLSYKVGCRKPEKRIYQIALKKLRVKPNECIFIDNEKDKLLPAKRLGMKTILFKSVNQLKRELNNLL